MVKLVVKIRPQRGYTFPNCIKQIEVDSSTRLEDILSTVKIEKKGTFLYSPTGIEMPLNSSLASHNIQNGDIIETCSSPMLSAVLSAVVADLESVKETPEEYLSRDSIKNLLDCTDNTTILESDWNLDRWRSDHLQRRSTCLKTIKMALQRKDRFATKKVPPCHDLTSLFHFVKNNNVFSSASNGHSTGLECFKPSAKNRDGAPTICWELLLNKIDKLIQVNPEEEDLIEPFLKRECSRHGNLQSAPVRTTANRSCGNSKRPTRNLFLTTTAVVSTNAFTCVECSHAHALVNADSVCIKAACPFYSKPTCRNCFQANHPVLTRNHERVFIDDPKARAVLKTMSSTDTYCPEFASGPFAILCTLLQAQRNRQYFLTESVLKAKAQLQCRANLYDSQSYRQNAFSCMDTLTRKNLVRKEMIHGSDDGKYSLLPAGETLAKYCLDFKTAVDAYVVSYTLAPAINDPFLSKTVDIFYDQREDKTLAARFRSRCHDAGVQCSEKELPAGDYLFLMEGNVLPLVVERKTWSDFADSVQGKGKKQLRLECLRNSRSDFCNCQLCRMKRAKAGQVMFVIEGGRCRNTDAQPDNCSAQKLCIYCKELKSRHGICQDQLEDQIFCLLVQHQCFVHFTRDYNETVSLLLTLTKILPAVHKRKNQKLTYDQFCFNAKSRQSTYLKLRERGNIHEIKDDEFINALASGDRSTMEWFHQKISDGIANTLQDVINLTTTDADPDLECTGDDSVIDLSDSQPSVLILEPYELNTPTVNLEDDVELLNDSPFFSPPKAKKARISQPFEVFEPVMSDAPGSEIQLIVFSGLYEYYAQYDHDLNKVWQSMYKSRNASSLDFMTDAKKRIMQIQGHPENSPLTNRTCILYWLLYLQLNFDVIIFNHRQTLSLEKLACLWKETEISSQLMPIAAASTLEHGKLLSATQTSHLPQSSSKAASLSGPSNPLYQEEHSSFATSTRVETREARLRYFEPWACGECTFAENKSTAEFCKLCNTERNFTTNNSSTPQQRQQYTYESNDNYLSHATYSSKQNSKPVSNFPPQTNTKSKRCGACKEIGHDRSNYGPHCCTRYFDEAEVAWRKKKREEAARSKEEIERKINEEKIRDQERAANAEKLLSLVAKMQRSNEADLQVSEAAQKEREKALARLQRREAKYNR